MGRCVIKVQGGIRVVCPQGSVMQGDFCLLTPQKPGVNYICPTGSEQLSDNTCRYRIPEKQIVTEVVCPPGMTQVGLDRCVHYVDNNQCRETHETTGHEVINDECNQQQPTVIHNNNTVKYS